MMPSEFIQSPESRRRSFCCSRLGNSTYTGSPWDGGQPYCGDRVSLSNIAKTEPPSASIWRNWPAILQPETAICAFAECWRELAGSREFVERLDNFLGYEEN